MIVPYWRTIMNEHEKIELDDDFMGDDSLSDEYDWNQLQVDETQATENLSYEQEDWITTCY